MLEFLTTIAYICAFILIAPAFLLILFDVSFLAVVSAYNKKYSSKKNSYQLLRQLPTPFLKVICIYCITKNQFTTNS
ncbi:unnamed protein product [Rhizophagus irregularis]|nr:unnamed protein product [Rhizophagus irregularis]